MDNRGLIVHNIQVKILISEEKIEVENNVGMYA